MKNRDDFQQIAREILAGEWDDHLAGLFEAYRARKKAQRSERAEFAAATVRIGDRGTLDGISPKYLNGCPVEVTGKNAKTLDVVAIEEGSTLRQKERLRFGGRVPASCFVPETTKSRADES